MNFENIVFTVIFATFVGACMGYVEGIALERSRRDHAILGAVLLFFTSICILSVERCSERRWENQKFERIMGAP